MLFGKFAHHYAQGEAKFFKPEGPKLGFWVEFWAAEENVS